MSHNDITGDKIATNAATEAYRDGHDRIFSKPSRCASAGVAVQEQQKTAGDAGGAHVLSGCKWPLVADDSTKPRAR